MSWQLVNMNPHTSGRSQPCLTELEREFQITNRALRVLSACTQAVVRATDEVALLQTLCQLITEEATYRMAWVGYVCHDEAKSVRPMAWAGHEADYLKTINITWANTERGQGPTGRAIRSGQVVACQNMLTDPNFAPWREAAQQRGYQSSLVLLLREGEVVFGTLNIYSAEADAFNPQEVVFLTELADSLSFGILALRAEQKHHCAVQALQRSEEKFAKAFYSSPIAKSMIDLNEGRYIDVNHSFEKLFGYKREEIIGLTVLETLWYNPAHRQPMIEQLQAQGCLQGYEAELKDHNGKRILCRVSIELIQIEERVCALSTIEDITERRQAELTILRLNEDLEQRVEERTAALQKSQEFLRLLTDSLPVCILYLDREQRHQFINHTYEIWFKTSRADILGKTVLEVVGPEVYERIQGYLDQAYGGESVTYEYTIEQASTHPRILQITILPDENPQQQVQGCFLLFADITPLKLIEQELQRSNQELEQFAYVASHDLQEPLRAITGYTQLLLQQYGDRFDDTAQSYADFVVDGAKRMQQLIQDLLAYSRVGTRGKEFAPTDCNLVVQQALRNLQMTIAERQAVITVDPLPTLQVDQNQLIQVFQNLIGNALKFCRAEPPQVQIWAEQQGMDYFFSIRDNGIGIKPQYLDRIFEIFKRLHTRREYPGTGIGLAICKKIVLRHGGQIWAESEPGCGTTFHFTIPCQNHESQS